MNRFENLSTIPGIGDDQFAVVVVGSLIPIKGHETLLNALAMLEDNTVQCHIVGTGPLESELKKMASNQGIDSSITFHGFRDDIPDVMHSADIAVCPSYSEAFPRVVLEAMAAGTATVASDVGGIPEAVDDGETGLLVPPGNPERLLLAIQELMVNTAQRNRMAEKGKQRVKKKFRFDMGVSKIEEIYKSLVSKPAG
jgi:glycosyltransferase involved in cell wall biosynthesis